MPPHDLFIRVQGSFGMAQSYQQTDADFLPCGVICGIVCHFAHILEKIITQGAIDPFRLKRANRASVHKSAYCAHLRISTEQMRVTYVKCALLCANAYCIVHFCLLLGANGNRIA